MSDPQPYTVSYSFGSFQANNPAVPLPALRHDEQYAAIARAEAEIVAALRDIRRSDGALKNNIVTFDSLEKGLQLLTDPTNGQLVAAAVASAQDAQISAAGSATAAAGSATNAAGSAAAAAASASGVNLALYLSKAGNLAGIGDPNTARGTLLGMKVDASDATSRFAAYSSVNGVAVTNWNTVLENGWYSATSASNQPSYASVNDWLVHVVAHSALYVVQTAYAYTQAATGYDNVMPMRRYGYNNAGSIAWTKWQAAGALPIGSTILVNDNKAPVGFLKENGALISRTTYAALWDYANQSGALVDEATWTASSWGAFSTGDLSTTFRLPDSRGEFIRGFDDGRGVDSGRAIGVRQADSLKDHTHTYTQPGTLVGLQGGGTYPSAYIGSAGGTSGSPSTGVAAETRPRNIPKLVCIKAY